MSDQSDRSASERTDAAGLELDGVDERDLDGHTIEELSDYLDRGRMPPQPSIDESAECQAALTALSRLREVSASLLESEAEAAPDRGDDWVRRILELIAQEARSGRDIPYTAPAPSQRLEITEGAVRGVVRAAGDDVGTLLIGRCTLDGDVTIPGEPISVLVEANAIFGENILEAVAAVRAAIYAGLRAHTSLEVITVDITVRDLQTGEET